MFGDPTLHLGISVVNIHYCTERKILCQHCVLIKENYNIPQCHVIGGIFSSVVSVTDG